MAGKLAIYLPVKFNCCEKGLNIYEKGKYSEENGIPGWIFNVDMNGNGKQG